MRTTNAATIRPAGSGEGDEIRDLLRVAYREHAERVPARELMTSGAHRARRAGATAVGLHPTAFMTGTLRLCERLGYHRTPEWDTDLRAHYGLADGASLVALTYVLDVESEPLR